MQYLYLALAILAEVIATSALQASQQFTRLGPSILVVLGYAAAFYFLSLTLRTMPVGIVYAIWAGAGVVLIALIGLVLFGQRLDLPAILGLCMIVSGIVVIRVFSTTSTH